MVTGALQLLPLQSAISAAAGAYAHCCCCLYFSCCCCLVLLLLLLQERPFPRRPADMPVFATADTPAGSTHRQQPAALHDAAVKQHMAEVVDAAYAAAGLPRPRRGSEIDDDLGLNAAGYRGQPPAGVDDLPATLYQRFDTARDGVKPVVKRPRPSLGL